jgi:hypothetical protein
MSGQAGLKRGLVAGAAASVLINGAVFTWWASSSFSWGVPLPGSEFTLLLAVAALVAATVGGLLLLFRRTRGAGLFLMPAGLILVFSFFLALRAGGAMRMWGFERFAERATPIVDAIERYSKEKGQPPPSLEELVPDYLPSIPATGVGSAREFRYIAGEQAEGQYGGNPWVLELAVGTGFLNWDILIYYPLQNYPEHGHGGMLEPVGNWAYVHE